MKRLILLLVTSAVAGCPTPTPSDSGEPDASSPDSPLDAMANDVGDVADAGADAGSPDAPAEMCGADGEMRTASCGSCGLQSQRCAGGAWTDVGPCIGEGECPAGALESRAPGMCAEETRICTDACTWSDWDETTPPGVCLAGQTRIVADGCSPGVGRIELCNDACAWAATGECEPPCRGAPRTAPEDAIDICVPAGSFLRGNMGATDGDARPARTITLSAYYIDRFSVTNRRYGQCVSAGACTAPMNVDGNAAYLDPAYVTHPVTGLSFSQAAAFCAWDGGRRLPSEAEWEKAARGPSPRTNLYPWGDSVDCAIMNAMGCGSATFSRRVERAYNELPLTASHYGVEMLVGGPWQWVADYFSDEYYATSPDIDPVNMVPSGTRLLRGSWETDPWSAHLVFQRHLNSENASFATGVRCARDAI